MQEQCLNLAGSNERVVQTINKPFALIYVKLQLNFVDMDV